MRFCTPTQRHLMYPLLVMLVSCGDNQHPQSLSANEPSHPRYAPYENPSTPQPVFPFNPSSQEPLEELLGQIEISCQTHVACPSAVGSLVRLYDSNNSFDRLLGLSSYSRCTFFIDTNGHAITNAHCVQQVDPHFCSDVLGFKLPNGEARRCKTILFKSDYDTQAGNLDVAVIELDTPFSIKGLKISSDPTEPSKTYSRFSPDYGTSQFNKVGTLKEYHCHSVRNKGDLEPHNNSPFFVREFNNCFVQEGFSGSPYLNDQGEVVAIVQSMKSQKAQKIPGLDEDGEALIQAFGEELYAKHYQVSSQFQCLHVDGEHTKPDPKCQPNKYLIVSHYLRALESLRNTYLDIKNENEAFLNKALSETQKIYPHLKLGVRTYSQRGITRHIMVPICYLRTAKRGFFNWFGVPAIEALAPVDTLNLSSYDLLWSLDSHLELIISKNNKTFSSSIDWLGEKLYYLAPSLTENEPAKWVDIPNC